MSFQNLSRTCDGSKQKKTEQTILFIHIVFLLEFLIPQHFIEIQLLRKPIHRPICNIFIYIYIYVYSDFCTSYHTTISTIINRYSVYVIRISSNYSGSKTELNLDNKHSPGTRCDSLQTLVFQPHILGLLPQITV